jgi:hypothetical protein
MPGVKDAHRRRRAERYPQRRRQRRHVRVPAGLRIEHDQRFCSGHGRDPIRSYDVRRHRRCVEPYAAGLIRRRDRTREPSRSSLNFDPASSRSIHDKPSDVDFSTGHLAIVIRCRSMNHARFPPRKRLPTRSQRFVGNCKLKTSVTVNGRAPWSICSQLNEQLCEIVRISEIDDISALVLFNLLGYFAIQSYSHVARSVRPVVRCFFPGKPWALLA